jgi:hypothetical protein
MDPLTTEESFITGLVQEAYAAHAMLTNLGFEPDEVFVGVQPVVNVNPPGLCALVQLRAQGRVFTLPIDRVTREQSKWFLEAFKAFAADQPTMPRPILDQIMRESLMYARRREMLTALVAKGFKLRPGEMVN